jgi:hypothetical protein
MDRLDYIHKIPWMNLFHIAPAGSGRRGLGFDGLLQKACLVVGLSMPMDKPIAKCRNCEERARGVKY